MFLRGKFGIEYNPRQVENESSGLGWVFVLIALVASISLIWTVVRRLRAAGEEKAAEVVVVSNDVPRASAPVATKPAKPVLSSQELSRRPAKVRNLLMRLGEAEQKGDYEMAVTTIETIRSLPGDQAADLDDSLARRLGTLNLRRLFVERNAQWVKPVTVGRGDSASRIAAENGSTLASLAKLNGGNVDRVILGAKLYVMDHPRFNLVIHRRSRMADLSLNGKFFKRYDLQDAVTAKEGAYELSDRKRAFWGKLGISLKKADQEELEMLLPTGTPVLISEM